MTDDEGLELARREGERSGDPSTKVGCVIVGHLGAVEGRGSNAFPEGVEATRARLRDRHARLALTVHAEVCALVGLPPRATRGATAYVWPWPPCSACAGALAVAGVARVVAPRPTAEQEERWGDSFRWMRVILEEAGVELVEVSRAHD